MLFRSIWIGNDLEKQKMTPNSTGGRIPARIAKMFLEDILTKNQLTNEKANENTTSQKSLGALLNLQ